MDEICGVVRWVDGWMISGGMTSGEMISGGMTSGGRISGGDCRETP